MIQIIEAPTYFDTTSAKKTLFLAGGISKCPDWQTELTEMLKDENLICFNPRRKSFPKELVRDRETSKEQIRWEFKHLCWAQGISFWFPKETLCPITLYELGAWNSSRKPIFIGMHPDYARREDIEIQTEQVRPGLEIVYSLPELAQQVKTWNNN